jgi:hypothetical protein
MSIVRSKFRFLLILTFVSAALVVATVLKMRRVSSAVNRESQSAVFQRGRVQVVRFTLYDAGIYPQEIRASQGLVTISIEDLTGSSSGVFVQLVEPTVRVAAGSVNKATNQLRSRAELLLSAGRYEVVDATRPDNRASLIVEP